LDFAKAYVRTHVNGGNKGPITLQIELKEKGIDEKIIQQALLEYPFDVQVDHAKYLAEKSIKKEKNISERALKQKLEQMLTRKGFTRDCLLIALEDITIEKDDEEQWDALCYHAEKLVQRYQAYEGFQFQQKVKQALFRKGFPLDLIDRYLSELDDAY
jgi:regulatory protein